MLTFNYFSIKISILCSFSLSKYQLSFVLFHNLIALFVVFSIKMSTFITKLYIILSQLISLFLSQYRDSWIFLSKCRSFRFYQRRQHFYCSVYQNIDIFCFFFSSKINSLAVNFFLSRFYQFQYILGFLYPNIDCSFLSI